MLIAYRGENTIHSFHLGKLLLLLLLLLTRTALTLTLARLLKHAAINMTTIH